MFAFFQAPPLLENRILSTTPYATAAQKTVTARGFGFTNQINNKILTNKYHILTYLFPIYWTQYYVQDITTVSILELKTALRSIQLGHTNIDDGV